MSELALPAYVFDTDGRTLWVNSPTMCLGRVQPAAAEVFIEGKTTITIPFGHPTQMEVVWAKFVELMLTHHDVPITDDQQPAWLAPQ